MTSPITQNQHTSRVTWSAQDEERLATVAGRRSGDRPLKERVTSGVYASESEVVRDGLRALFAQETVVETWLRSEVVASYDEQRADPSEEISAAEMRVHLAEVHARRLAERDS